MFNFIHSPSLKSTKSGEGTKLNTSTSIPGSINDNITTGGDQSINQNQQRSCDCQFQLRTWYARAFLIPRYRPEWGTYIRWNPKIKLKGVDRIQRKGNRRLKTVTEAAPRPKIHDHSECLLIRINVSGRIFEPQVRCLQRFPETLLGNPKRMMRFFDPQRNEYFFDRHRTSFEAILSYYQTGGVIRKPQVMSFDHFMEEVKFYDLGPEVIKILEDSTGFYVKQEKSLPKCLLRRKLWLLFEYPESSYQSKIFAYLSIFAVCLSIGEFCVETMTIFDTQINTATPKSTVRIEKHPFDILDPFYLTETICVIFFSFEYLVRAMLCPCVLTHLRNFSNLMDLVAIMPYFIQRLYQLREDPHRPGSLTVIKAIRLASVFRILKLSRHNKGLQVLGKTLKASVEVLGLLLFSIVLGVIVFSSVMFFAEQSNPNSRFDSIPTGFWFSIVTMTTLGYGDIYPISKIVGAMCAIAGVLTISLPVPVISSNFNTFYTRGQNYTRTSQESRHVEQCPFYPGLYNSEGTFIGRGDRPDNQEITRNRVKEQNDGSDTDFEELKKDEMFKKEKKRHPKVRIAIPV